MSNPLDAFQDSEGLKIGIISQLFKRGIELLTKKDYLLSLCYFVLLLGVLILLICTEPLKLVMRRNFGIKALSFIGIILSAILMFAWAGNLLSALIEFYNSGDAKPSSWYLSYLSNLYFVSFIILAYFIFGVYILIKGIKQYIIASNSESSEPKDVYYRGDCVVLHKLIKTGVPQDKVWRKSEPWFCFKMGLLLTLIHPFLGFPILLMTISFFVNEWYNVKYKWDRVKERQQDAKIQAKLITMQQQKPGYTPFR